VKIVYQESAPMGRESGADPHPDSRVIVELTDIGPLSSADAKWVIDRLGEIEAEKLGLLRSRSAQAGDSGHLLEEAQLLLDVQTAKSAAAAMQQGTYTVTEPDAAAPSLFMPECEVCRMGALKDGKPSNVTILMPWKSHPELAKTREYRDAMRRFDDSEKARAFNALGDAEREVLAKRLRDIMQADSATQEEREFVVKTLGFRTQLVGGGNIAIVPE
jgi:hypothetical protein